MRWALLLALARRLRRFEAEPAGADPFGYGAHGADWLEGCQSRTAQSPVNLRGDLTTSPPAGAFEVSYPPLSSVRLENSGVSLVAAGLKGALVLDGAKYELSELAVHAPSEHTLNGQRADLELQLSHTLAGTDRRVILSMLANAPGPRPARPALMQVDPDPDLDPVDMIRDGTDEQPEGPGAAEVDEVERLDRAAEQLDLRGWALARVNVSNLTYHPPASADPGYAFGLSGLLATELPLPEAVSEVPLEATPWDLGALIPEAARFVSYAGSGSTPPCKENVQWLVSSEPTSVSSDQVARLTAAMKRVASAGNWRVVMPFNRRHTKVFAVHHRDSILATTPPPDAKAPDPRKMAAWANAEDAVVIADYAKRYTRDLDQALRTAAVAHLRGYIDPLPTTSTPAPPPPTVKPVPKVWLDKRQREKALHSAAANGVAAVVRGMVEAAAKGMKIAASLGDEQLHGAIDEAVG